MAQSLTVATSLGAVASLRQTGAVRRCRPRRHLETAPTEETVEQGRVFDADVRANEANQLVTEEHSVRIGTSREVGDLVEQSEHGHHRSVYADGVCVEISRCEGAACPASLDSGSIEVFGGAHTADRACDIGETDVA